MTERNGAGPDALVDRIANELAELVDAVPQLQRRPRSPALRPCHEAAG